MSECVVRMTLPKACVWRDDKGNIKMCSLYWEDEARCQGKDGKEAPWYDGKRPDWCPIICQLPEGHGRLGDLDALTRLMLERKQPLVGADSSKDRYRYMQWLADFNAIKDVKTVVPEERRRER